MTQTLKQLPWELEENILSRLPPPSLVRLRTVCLFSTTRVSSTTTSLALVPDSSSSAVPKTIR
ncbi:unnamed protein product [Brassica rapa subsp. trilocularis]